MEVWEALAEARKIEKMNIRDAVPHCQVKWWTHCPIARRPNPLVGDEDPSEWTDEDFAMILTQMKFKHASEILKTLCNAPGMDTYNDYHDVLDKTPAAFGAKFLANLSETDGAEAAHILLYSDMRDSDKAAAIIADMQVSKAVAILADMFDDPDAAGITAAKIFAKMSIGKVSGILVEMDNDNVANGHSVAIILEEMELVNPQMAARLKGKKRFRVACEPFE